MANILSSWGRLYYSQLQMRKSRLREVRKPAWYHTARKWWAVTATLQGLLTLYSCPPPLCQVWTPTTVFWKIGEGQSWRGQMDPEHRPPPGPQGLPCQLQPDSPPCRAQLRTLQEMFWLLLPGFQGFTWLFWSISPGMCILLIIFNRGFWDMIVMLYRADRREVWGQARLSSLSSKL